MQHDGARDLPPCAMSLHCLRLVDGLDSLAPITDDLQDQLLIAQLRTHIPTCITCKAVLAQARLRRSQLRASLQTILLESEERIPSTVLSIREALRREVAREVSSSDKSAKKEPFSVIQTPFQPKQLTRASQMFDHSSPQPNRSVLRTSIAIAVAAVLILASVGLFNHRFFPSSKFGTSQQTISATANALSTRSPHAGDASLFYGWDAAMMAIPNTSRTDSFVTIRNYNFFQNTYSSLGKDMIPSKTVFDGIAPDGSDLLYQISLGGHTLYYRLLNPRANTGFFYKLNEENAGNAIWMSDSRHILIGTKDMGVVQVDTLTGQSTVILPQLMTEQLEFYHNGYLYFIDTNSEFSRVNLTTGVVTYLTPYTMITSLWYSPDGTKIYSVEAGQAGIGIYSMNLDGTNQQFISNAGTPIGFAADNSLLVMRYANKQFQVIKLGATVLQDQLVFENAAPGAISLCPAQMRTPNQICDNFVAMAPYGHALVVQGTDADGTYHVWLDNLLSQKQVSLQPTTDTRIAVQLLGWDRLAGT